MKRASAIVTLSLLSLLAATLAWAVQVDGRVVDQDGVGQSEIEVIFIGDDTDYSTWTDESGRFSIDVAPGRYQVEVSGFDRMIEVIVAADGSMEPNPLIAR